MDGGYVLLDGLKKYLNMKLVTKYTWAAIDIAGSATQVNFVLETMKCPPGPMVNWKADKTSAE